MANIIMSIIIARSEFGDNIPQSIKVDGVCYEFAGEDVLVPNTTEFTEYDSCDACASPAPSPESEFSSYIYTPCPNFSGDNIVISKAAGDALVKPIIKVGNICYVRLQASNNPVTDTIDDSFATCGSCENDISPSPSPGAEISSPSPSGPCVDGVCPGSFAGENYSVSNIIIDNGESSAAEVGKEIAPSGCDGATVSSTISDCLADGTVGACVAYIANLTISTDEGITGGYRWVAEVSNCVVWSEPYVDVATESETISVTWHKYDIATNNCLGETSTGSVDIDTVG